MKGTEQKRAVLHRPILNEAGMRSELGELVDPLLRDDSPAGGVRPRRLRRLLTSSLLFALPACTAQEPGPGSVAGDSLHVRVLAIHDFHGALNSTTYPGSDRPVGGAATVKAVMDTLEAACRCPTVRLDGGDQMQGTLESNLTHGASVVVALNHMGLDAAAVGNHELDWGVDTLLVRQREARYAWLAANVFGVSGGTRPGWAKPFAIVDRAGVRFGVLGYATVSTPRTLRPDVTAPYEFRAGYAGIRDALDQVWRERPDFVVIVAHAAGDCDGPSCSGEMVELAAELPPGSVHLIVGGHDHEPGQAVVNSIPIVRAGSNGRGIGVVDLHRRSDGSHEFRVHRQSVYADGIPPDSAMTRILAPYLRTAAALGGVRVTTLAEPLSASPAGDRRHGTLIAESIRLTGEADFGLHNPGGVRIDLPGGDISYAQLHRVMPFGNAVVRLTITGQQLRELAERTGPRYYHANVVIEYPTDPDAPSFGRASLTFPDGTPVLEDRAYTLATNDFLADGGDGLSMLSALPREAIGVTVLDAVVHHLRTLPTPVALPFP
jgi:2',3'-cyclic-nucleotide 2'-phosphodiesterase (5'-nucleotidase family)